MLAVSDADVLIHLAKIDRLELLGRLYGPVLVPAFVKQEALPGRFPDEAVISRAFQEGSLVAAEADPVAAGRIAEAHGIDPGEGRVKALAESRKVALVLSNENRVRRAARAEGFEVTGTLGVLLRAVKAGHLARAEAGALLKRIASEERMFPSTPPWFGGPLKRCAGSEHDPHTLRPSDAAMHLAARVGEVVQFEVGGGGGAGGEEEKVAHQTARVILLP